MAGVGIGQLNGWYKTRYGEMQKLVPEWAVLQGMIPFEEREQLGKDFREPIFLRRSQGVTFAAGTNLGTIYSLNNPIPLQSEEAVLTPAEIVLREQLAYGAIAAAWNRGPAAFGSAMDEVILGLDESHRFYVEALMLYGGTSIGQVSTITANTATTLIVQLTAASWAAGIWAQGEKMLIDFYDTVGGTIINTNAAVEFTSFNDIDNRKINITGAAADITLLGTGAQTYVIVFRGAGGATATTFNGVDKIVTNTGSLYGISAATYGLWQSSGVTLTGPLTLSAIHGATTRMVVRGGYGAVTYLLNPYAWQDLCDDQSALRRYASDNKKEFQNGADELTFYGTNGGKMTLKPHPMVKQSEAFGLMTDEWIRGGVSDLTNRLPGTGNEDFFLEIPDKSGCEIRNFSSQFIYCRKPAKQVKISGIVPRSAPT